LPDEQWEHYTDIEKKCKRFDWTVDAIAQSTSTQPHFPVFLRQNIRKSTFKTWPKTSKARIAWMGLAISINQC
jgi:hypothetical protein